MRRSEKKAAESDVPELTRLFESGDVEARKEAALALGSLGSRGCTGPVLAALADDDNYVRSYAMMGIERGLASRRCDRSFLDAVFPALVKLLNRDDGSVSGRASQLLLDIDAQKALPILLSPDYFTTENSQLSYILRALNHRNDAIPHAKLLPLLTELRTSADKYPRDYHYAEAIIAYGRNPDAQAADWIRSELTSANEKVREGAAEALAILSGISNPFHYVCGIMERDGFDQLTDPQKHFFAVSVYKWEVENGGHSQYFFNSSGSYWNSALAGLRAIAAEARATILAKAAAKFGSSVPARDRAKRIAALRELEQRTGKPFNDLDDEFYAADEDLDVLLALYAVKNKAHFTDSVTPEP